MKFDSNKIFQFLFSPIWHSTEEWVKIDIAWKIKNWIEENDLEHVIDISCNTCEKHPSMDMLSLDQGYRPFIVINTHPSRKIKRQRRSLNCSPGVTECCREKLYISFADIGWDDWILYPPGNEINLHWKNQCGLFFIFYRILRLSCILLPWIVRIGSCHNIKWFIL